MIGGWKVETRRYKISGSRRVTELSEVAVGDARLREAVQGEYERFRIRLQIKHLTRDWEVN